MTATHVGVSVYLTPPGRVIPGTGHHSQSLESPPIRMTGDWSGVMLRIRFMSVGLMSVGSVPAYGSIDGYSIERPRKPGRIGWTFIGGPMVRERAFLGVEVRTAVPLSAAAPVGALPLAARLAAGPAGLVGARAGAGVVVARTRARGDQRERQRNSRRQG